MGEQQIERRTLQTSELRVLDSTDGPVIEGYAAVFDQWSEDLGGFREMIAPGAFAAALDGTPDVRALVNHDPNYVLGRTGPLTLVLAQDEVGLRMTARPPDTQWARDLLVSMRRGDVNQMSFSFEVAREGQRWEDTPLGVRRWVTQIERLYDVSVVTFPAYPQTSAQARALVQEMVQARAQAGPVADSDDDAAQAGAAEAQARMEADGRARAIALAKVGGNPWR